MNSIDNLSESESESSYEDVTSQSSNEEISQSGSSCDDDASQSSDEDISQTENLNLNLNIINDYNVIYELGRGSYSIVWLAYNINNSKFYALKVQNPNEYKEGINEITFVKKLPKNPNIFNNIINSFIEIVDNKKYLCSVWNLHAFNIDYLIRKTEYKISIDNVKFIMKQLITAIDILHNKFKVYHGDIKTDNILIKGLNEKDEFFINEYINVYKNEYNKEIENFCVTNKIKLVNISKDNKNKIRLDIHKNLTEKILDKINNHNLQLENINLNFLEKINISLADFGTYCDEDNYYDEPFGTRYYQAPEIILMSKCSYPVDIWALGCTFYELLTGEVLFDPAKDSTHSRDYYHLCLINETCGNFTNNFLEKTKFYKDFFDSESNIINHINKLNEKLDKFDPECSKLLKDMLVIDPNKRITIQELKTTNYFNQPEPLNK